MNLKLNGMTGIKQGRVGPMPRAPFLVNNSGEARKYFGGTGNDWQRIKGEREMKATACR
jgi:hypothetical protein